MARSVSMRRTGGNTSAGFFRRPPPPSSGGASGGGSASAVARAPIVSRTRTAYYDPSRIIDRSQIEFVDSIAAERQKQFSDERGDNVSPVSGKPLFPGQRSVETETLDKQPTDGAKLIGALLAAYFFFGA